MPYELDDNGKLVRTASKGPAAPAQLQNTMGVDLAKYENYLAPGESYIKGEYDQQKWDDNRARNQSGTEKALNSIGQGVGTFGTALASGVGALVSGAVALGAEAITGGEAKGMDIFINNPFMKGIDNFDKYLKEDLIPTYYTKEQQESLLSASTGTDLLNGLGFMASAFVPNAAIGKLFGTWSKMASVAKAGKLPAVLAAAEEAGTLTNMERKLLSSFGTHLDKAGPIVGGVVGRIGESSMEAYQTYNQIKESLTAERDQAQQEIEMTGQATNPSALLSDEEIENRAKDGRNNVFGGNMALAVSDIAQYTRWFRGGGLGERLTKEGLKTVIKTKTKGEILGGLLKESAQEAGEEGFQFLLSKGAEKSAKGKSFLEGIREASGDLFTTVEGQKSMLLGAILGGGMSSIAEAKNSKKTKETLNAMAAELTSTGDASQRYITDPTTGKKIVNPELTKIATTFAFYEKQKDDALDQGDQDAYDIAEKMQFSHLVEAKMKAGQFDDFINELQDMGNTNPEEIKAMFGELPIKNGKEMSPSEVAFDKIQLAKRVKQMTEGLQNLPGMEKLGANGMDMTKHMLFTQESLRDQVKLKDEKIAEIQSRAVYNPFPVENAELFEQEDSLLPQDKQELQKTIIEKDIILKKYKDISDVFKEIVAKPEVAQKKADDAQEAAISKAVDALTTELKKEGQDLAKAVGQTITVEDAQGNKVDVVIATDEDGNFINETTGEMLPNEIVLEQTAEPVIELTEEELPEFDEEVITNDEEDTNDTTIDEYQKKTTVNASTGQALEIEGGKAVIKNGERVENPKFVEQTKIFNDPTISNNVVTNPTNAPNIITFKAERGAITEKELNDTNARRRAKGLEPITMEQIKNDPDFVPIVLTLIVNGVVKNTAKSYYHNPDYYYDTAEYDMIERSKDIPQKTKEELHKKNIEKYKAIRANLLQQITDEKPAILETAGKSRGVLNYNPKVDEERKTSNVIGILAENFKELLNGIQNKLFSVENDGKVNPINTQGIRIVTSVKEMKDGNFIISTQSNNSKSSFVSQIEYSVGTMLLDIVAPNGDVVTTSPFTKTRFAPKQLESLAELVLEKLQGKNTIDVGGSLFTISGTEAIPGILDSLIYVGKVKSSDPDAINAQLYFTKDGRLQLGTKTYDANTEGIYDLIKEHIFKYKARPHFKFKSIEVFGKNFGIPVKQENGTFKIENPAEYMEFMFGGKNPLISTALNPTKFVNSYFKFASNNDSTLIVEEKETKVEPIITPEAVSDIEAKKADIERRRQEELKRITLEELKKELKGYTLRLIPIEDKIGNSFRISDIDENEIFVNYITEDGNNSNFALPIKGDSRLIEKYKNAEWSDRDINDKYDAELAALEGKTKEVVEEVTEESLNKAADDAVNEKVNDCKGVEASPNEKTTSKSSNISKAADNYSWE